MFADKIRIGVARILLKIDMKYNFIDPIFLQKREDIPKSLSSREYWALNLFWRGVFPDSKFETQDQNFDERYNKVEKLAFNLFRNLLCFIRSMKRSARNLNGPSTGPVLLIDSKEIALQLDFLNNQQLDSYAENAKLRDVQIVIPIFNAFDYVRECVESVLRTTDMSDILLVDDCSTEIELLSYLEDLKENRRIRVIRNDKNLGFVKTANRGIRESRGKHVVILNSDTVVFRNWLPRLIYPIQEMANAWTVTAMSNAATIYSVPFSEEIEVSPNTSQILDELIGRKLVGNYVEIPTCHGFCVAIHMDAVETIGLFDEESFGRGYGEENDYSMRVIEHGKKNYLATNLIVHHYGSKSFKTSKQDLSKDNMKTLLNKHPDYLNSVRRFLERQELLHIRALALMIFARSRKDRLKVIFTHALGGGTDKSIDLENSEFQDLLVLIKPYSENSLLLEFRFNEKSQELILTNLESSNMILYFLNLINPSNIVFEHLLGYPKESISTFLLSSFAYKVRLHDYYYVCPKIHLSGTDHKDCQLPEISKCINCLFVSGEKDLDILSWRLEKLTFLKNAESIYASTYDVSDRYNKFAKLDIQISPIDIQAIGFSRDSVASIRKHRVIAILGNLNQNKGSQNVIDLVNELDRNDGKFEVVQIGAVLDDRLLNRNLRFKSLGKYSSLDELDSKLMDIRPDLFFFPSRVPETFSFTLSEALRYDLPIAYFNTGAIAERLRFYDKKILLELEYTPSQVLACILSRMDELDGKKEE